MSISMFLHQGQFLSRLCLDSLDQCLLYHRSNNYRKGPMRPKQRTIECFIVNVYSLLHSYCFYTNHGLWCFGRQLKFFWLTFSPDVLSASPIHVTMIRSFTWFLGLKWHVRVTSSPLATSMLAWLIVTSSPKLADITMRQRERTAWISYPKC